MTHNATVALLYHMPVFLQHNLKELWLHTGVGDITRYVPPHTRLGSYFCAVLQATPPWVCYHHQRPL